MYDADTPNCELTKGSHRDRSCEDERDPFGALLETEADSLVRLGAESIATAGVTQEYRAWGELNQPVDRLIDVRRRDESRAARPRHARGVDRNAPRRHGPQLGFWYWIEVGRQDP